MLTDITLLLCVKLMQIAKSQPPSLSKTAWTSELNHNDFILIAMYDVDQ